MAPRVELRANAHASFQFIVATFLLARYDVVDLQLSKATRTAELSLKLDVEFFDRHGDLAQRALWILAVELGLTDEDAAPVAVARVFKCRGYFANPS